MTDIKRDYVHPEEKSIIPRFTYRQSVKIKEGFYKGKYGVVLNFIIEKNTIYYRVKVRLERDNETEMLLKENELLSVKTLW